VKLSIIAAMDERGGIGLRNRLPWHLPDDLRRFKQLTLGHYLIVGRKTYESIGQPLVGRKMIVLSRSQKRLMQQGVLVVGDLESALEICQQAKENEVFVAGGAELFEAALPIADKLYLTKVLAVVEADTFFPPWDEGDWEIVYQFEHPIDERHAFPFRFIDYVRKKPKL
jgi:dihydrofolate reductase